MVTVSDNDDVYELRWQYDEKDNTVRQSFHGKDAAIARKPRRYRHKKAQVQ